MAEFKRSKYYNDWLTFVEKVKDRKTEFGNVSSLQPFTVGEVARNIERATILSVVCSPYPFESIDAIKIFDSALDRLYSNEGPMFHGIYQELEDQTVSDTCAVIVLLMLSTYINHAIAKLNTIKDPEIFKHTFDNLYCDISNNIVVDDNTIILQATGMNHMQLNAPDKILSIDDLQTLENKMCCNSAEEIKYTCCEF